MFIGIGLALTGRGGASAPPTAANQAIEFGRKTIVGDGDGLSAIVSTGGAITSITLGTRTVGSNHFSGGSTLVPTSVPSDAQYVWTGCTVTGPGGTSGTFTLTIDTIANAYSIKPDMDELEAALAACTGGETIYCRAGTELTDPNRDIRGYGAGQGGKPTYSDYVTIRSHDTDNKAWWYGFDFLGCAYIYLYDLKLGRSESQGGSETAANVRFRATAGTFANTNHCKVNFCEFKGDAVDGSNGAFQLEFKGLSTANPLDIFQAIGNTQQEGGHIGISASNCSNGIILGTDCANFGGDHVRISSYVGPMYVGFNKWLEIADDGDSGTHPDGLQNGVSTSTIDYTGPCYSFANIMDAMGGSEYSGGQFNFWNDVSNSGPYQYVGGVIVLNLARLRRAQGVQVDSLDGGVVFGNTTLHPVDGLLTTPTSIVKVQAGPSGGMSPSENVSVRWNIAHDVNTSDAANINVTQSDNIELTAQDVTAYNAHLDDPDNTDVIAAFKTKSGGTADTSPIKTGVWEGYLDRTTNNWKVDYPPANIASFTPPADITGAATSTATESAWFQVDVKKMFSGAAVLAGNSPHSEDSAIGVLLEIDSGEWRYADDASGTNATAYGSAAGIVPDGKYVRFRKTSSASNNTAVSINYNIGLNTSTGRVKTGTWSVTTLSFAVTPLDSAVDLNNLTTYDFTISTGTATANRKLAIGIRGDAGSARTVSSVVIDQGGANQVTADARFDTGSGNTTGGYWTGAYAAGGDITVRVVFSNSMSRAEIAVWALDGASSLTPTDTASSTADPASLDVDTPSGTSAVLVFYSGSISGSPTFAYTGAMEAAGSPVAVGEGNFHISYGTATATGAATPRTVTVDPSAAASSVYAVAAVFQ